MHADTQGSVQFFSQTQFSMQTPIRCPCVQLHASTSLRMLKSQALASIPLFGHSKILHPQVEMGSAALAAAVSIFECPNNVMDASAWDFNMRKDVEACNCTQGHRMGVTGKMTQ